MIIKNTCRILKLVGSLLLITLVLSPPSVIAQEPLPPDSSPPFDHHFGVVDSFVNTEEANAARVGWTRVFFRWDVVQPAGSFDWKPTNVPDTYLNAEIAAGREIAAVLIGTPAWATDSTTSTAVPPLDVWGDFVYKIATQYKGRIKHWIIWNQPDVTDLSSPGHTWDGNEEDYYRLLKEAYLKIKAVDPEMQVHLAGLTYTWDYNRGDRQYLARLLDIIVADPQAANENYYFDAVSYHIYYSPRQTLDVLTDVHSILDSYGLGHKPIWINETNAPPSEDYIESNIAPSLFKITLEEQSAFVIQTFALALAGGAERIAFYKMRNERADSGSVEPYGLLRSDNSRRPAFNAFQVVTTHFAGVQNTTWLQLGNVYVVTLDRGGQTTTALWNTATAPTIFTLNAVAPQALLVDERGNEQLITASNGTYGVRLPGALCSNKPNCFIGGAPRLIVESGSPDQRAPLLPLLTPTPTPSLPPPTNTPTPTATSLPPPTLTPTPLPSGVEGLPDTVLSPTATEASSETVVTPKPLSTAEETPSAILALPGPGVGDTETPADIAEGTEIAVKSTPIPPVTFSTVMTPPRILWLLIIGLIVFTVTYGIQVIIWYRVRR
jgi:hypothetical protein